MWWLWVRLVVEQVASRTHNHHIAIAISVGLFCQPTQLWFSCTLHCSNLTLAERVHITFDLFSLASTELEFLGVWFETKMNQVPWFVLSCGWCVSRKHTASDEMTAPFILYLYTEERYCITVLLHMLMWVTHYICKHELHDLLPCYTPRLRTLSHVEGIHSMAMCIHIHGQSCTKYYLLHRYHSLLKAQMGIQNESPLNCIDISSELRTNVIITTGT